MEHSFDVEEAVAFGVHEAVIIRHFRFWITKNRADKRHFHDGRTWETLARCSFPYLTEHQLRRIMHKLTSGEDSVMVKGYHNQDSFDRTLWYAFRNEEMMLR